ncbi:hypothetical protein BH23PLA1_BH23PLA1_27630 [soil metagenome]
MAEPSNLQIHVRAYRQRLAWSQEELARRSGLSRTGISAIEMGRLVPSTAAALALAMALDCRVEDLFRLGVSTDCGDTWVWPPKLQACRYWLAEVGGRVRAYPVEASPLGVVPHDGIYRDGSFQHRDGVDPRRTLVVACCDPAVGLLAAELARTADVRLLVLPRSSRSALTLLEQGVVHAAGLHLSRSDDQQGNAAAVKSLLGTGYNLLRITHWEEGLAHDPGRRLTSIRAAIGADLRWVGREAGSGARQCLDEVLGRKPAPRRMASDHRGVAEAIRCGWADAGICLRLASEEAGLDFLSVREEAYDLCYRDSDGDDTRMRALVEVVRSRPYRRLLAALPGYNDRETGAWQRVQ